MSLPFWGDKLSEIPLTPKIESNVARMYLGLKVPWGLEQIDKLRERVAFIVLHSEDDVSRTVEVSLETSPFVLFALRQADRSGCEMADVDQALREDARQFYRGVRYEKAERSPEEDPDLHWLLQAENRCSLIEIVQP